MPNIIGDIAGEYLTLMALLKQMPDDEVISLGDMVDRGPESHKVVEWFMRNGMAIMGNHEHMLLDFELNLGLYPQGCWVGNGGGKTIAAYKGRVSQEHVKWLLNLPTYLEREGCFLSHSFPDSEASLSEQTTLLHLNKSIIWNRFPPERAGVWNAHKPIHAMQIAGHNSQFGLRPFDDEQGEFAICIDTSRSDVLTGIHLPSFTIYQQPYVRK